MLWTTDLLIVDGVGSYIVNGYYYILVVYQIEHQHYRHKVLFGSGVPLI